MTDFDSDSDMTKHFLEIVPSPGKASGRHPKHWREQRFPKPSSCWRFSRRGNAKSNVTLSWIISTSLQFFNSSLFAVKVVCHVDQPINCHEPWSSSREMMWCNSMWCDDITWKWYWNWNEYDCDCDSWLWWNYETWCEMWNVNEMQFATIVRYSQEFFIARWCHWKRANPLNPLLEQLHWRQFGSQ